MALVELLGDFMDNRDELRELCVIHGRRFIYWIDPCGWVKGKGHRVSIVVEDESGHFPTGGNGKEPWYWGNRTNCAKSLQEAKDLAEKMNTEKFGYTVEQQNDIFISSIRLSIRSHR